MATMNRVFLIGNLTRDPETRRTSSGSVTANLRLAVSDQYRTKGGESVETTCFMDVSVWDRQAEVCETYLSKGSPVLIEGRLELDEWTDKQGQKRSKLRIRGNRVQFLRNSKKGAPSKGSRQKEPVPA